MLKSQLYAAEHKCDLVAHYMHSIQVAKRNDKLMIDRIHEQRQTEAIVGLLALPRSTQRLDDFFAFVVFVQQHGLQKK